MIISPDNKLTIAIVPFYCQAYGVREISDIPHIKAYQYIFCYHLVLSFRRIPMRNDRLCHSNDCKEEDSPLLRAQEKSLHFILSPTISPFFISRLSIHTVCDKLSEQLCHLWKRLCPTSEMVVQSAWHSCATAMAQLCQPIVTACAMPSY